MKNICFWGRDSGGEPKKNCCVEGTGPTALAQCDSLSCVRQRAGRTQRSSGHWSVKSKPQKQTTLRFYERMLDLQAFSGGETGLRRSSDGLPYLRYVHTGTTPP